MFAAVGMGAGVVDLYNDFSMNWGWSYGVQGGSGDTAFQYYLYDQWRWGVSPWDQPDRYHNESALTWAPKAVAPFLIMHGTSDPTVGFIHGLAFYNALRFNGKKAVLLAYPGEGHHLGGVANQKDLTAENLRKAGLNRVRWDLRSKGATTFPGLILRSANPARGPLVPPGTYRVRLTADGQSQEQALAVLKDPRLRDVTDADLQAQYELARQVSDRTGDAHQAVIRIRDLKAQIADRLGATPPAALKAAADSLLRKLSDIEEAIYQVKNRSPKDPLNFPIRLNNRIAALQDLIEAADARPTQQVYDVFKELSTELRGHLSRLEQVLTTDVAALNRSLAQMGREPIAVR
jgi:hypothetical protein